MNSERFVEALGKVTFENVFNPYSDRCAINDLVDAPDKRRGTLLAVLEAACHVEIDAIWVGRDLGYRGGRRTGLALTDDVHMDAHVRRWGITAMRPTRGGVVAERTAAVIWNILQKIPANVFLWNVFPLHPHEPDAPFSNRSHNARERDAGEGILLELIELLRPGRLVAIGNDAAKSVRRVSQSVNIRQVRHPSYGGQTEFIEKMHTLYKIQKSDAQPRLL